MKKHKVKTLRWWLLYWKVRVKQTLRSASPERSTRSMKYPNQISLEEKQALSIWTMVVHEDSSELMYNPQTYESYAEYHGPGGPVFLFLESRNMRIVNSVVGYDVRLTQHAEEWASNVFNREIHKRRSHFKAEVNSKVRHSLAALEERLRENLNTTES
jgi:hypothetical protein